MVIAKNSDVMDKNLGHIRIEQPQISPKSSLLSKKQMMCTPVNHNKSIQNY